MHVKSYCFRNCRYSPPWLQETASDGPLCSRRDHKQSRWYPNHCVPGRDSLLPKTQINKINQDTGHRTQIKKITSQQMKGYEGNCQTAAFIWLATFLTLKSLTYTFSPWIPNPLSTILPLMKKSCLEGNGRWSVRAQTHSEITSHLNKAPIKIRSLSLLTEFGMWQATRIPAFLVSLAMIIANFEPWLVWLSGLSTSLWTKRWLVQFPTRAHAWVPNQSTCLGCQPGPQ